MTIFKKVALELIRITCEKALLKSESYSAVGAVYNPKVAAAKQELLRELLETLNEKPEDLHSLPDEQLEESFSLTDEDPEKTLSPSDAETLLQLQDLLRNYQTRAVAITTNPDLTKNELPGTTEKIIAQLSASLHPIHALFKQLGLLDKEFCNQDALKSFYFQIGLYYAKIELRKAEISTEKGIFSDWVADARPFIKAQKDTVAAMFELCSKDVPPWDETKARDPSYQPSRAKDVLAYVNKLQVLHIDLISQQPKLGTHLSYLASFIHASSQITAFTFYSEALSEALNESIKALEALWGINAHLQSKILERAGDTASLSSDHSSADQIPGPRRLAALPPHVRADFQRAASSQRADKKPLVNEGVHAARAASFRTTELEEDPVLPDERPNTPQTTRKTHPASAAQLDTRKMPVAPARAAEKEEEFDFVDEPSPPNLSTTTQINSTDNGPQTNAGRMQEQPVLEDPSQKLAQPLPAASSNGPQAPLTHADAKQPAAIPPQPMQEPPVAASADGRNSPSLKFGLFREASKLVDADTASEQADTLVVPPPALAGKVEALTQEKSKKPTKAERRQAAADREAAAAATRPHK